MLVDDNELTLGGFVAGLRLCPTISLVAALTHAEAMAWTYRWGEADVVVVDAAKEDARGDHFPGVGVVESIRDSHGVDGPVVVVVTGHFLNDGLRHRMAEAGADFFFFRGNLRSADALIDVVLHSERYRRGVPEVVEGDRRAALGITQRSDVEKFVSYVARHGLQDAFDPENPTRNGPRSRTWSRHRRAIAEAAGIDAVNLTTGYPPHGQQRWPSLRQLRAVYGWAARTKGVKDGSPPAD